MSKKAKNVIEASEEIKDQNFMESLKSNEELRKVLFKAKNITNPSISVIVVNITVAETAGSILK